VIGDRARVSVLVAVPPEVAFRVFTEDIDQWWRRGPAYRAAGTRGVLHLEPHVGGRLFESFEVHGTTKVLETGRITTWEPPGRLAFDWRSVTFAPADQSTQVEVVFEPRPSGTFVTLTHSGWAAIRPDHPVRHGEDTEAFVRTLGLWWGALLTSLRQRASTR
jgi:uncharacterized protein YndB with AHSA1/START domain